jgi:hypothetical protein
MQFSKFFPLPCLGFSDAFLSTLTPSVYCNGQFPYFRESHAIGVNLQSRKQKVCIHIRCSSPEISAGGAPENEDIMIVQLQPRNVRPPTKRP